MLGSRKSLVLVLALGALGTAAGLRSSAPSSASTQPLAVDLGAGLGALPGESGGSSDAQAGSLPLAPPGATRDVALEEAFEPGRPGAGGPAATDAGEGAQKGPAATYAELLEFRAYVEEALVEVRALEAVKQRRALDARRSGLDLSMAQLERQLDLAPAQADRLRTLLLEGLEREAEYIWLWEHGAQDDSLEELKAKDREEQRKTLAGFLSPGQVSTLLSD